MLSACLSQPSGPQYWAAARRFRVDGGDSHLSTYEWQSPRCLVLVRSWTVEVDYQAVAPRPEEGEAGICLRLSGRDDG